jgi:outer membrane protein assembly factor BamB
VRALAAGRNPAGTEVLIAAGDYPSPDGGREAQIICYRAADGAVLWASREKIAAAPKGLLVSVSLDAAGDVLVAWNHPDADGSSRLAVGKLSGRDGRKLWERRSEWQDDESIHRITAAFPDLRGRVWVAGTRYRRPLDGTYDRFIALLGAGDGAPLWTRILPRAKEDHVARPALSPLADGEALLVIPTYRWKQDTPGILQRISALDGSPLWAQEFAGAPSSSSTKWKIDERAAQVVIIGNSREAMHSRTRAYDLRTGAERWRLGELSVRGTMGDIAEITLADNGDFILWSGVLYMGQHYRWRRFGFALWTRQLVTEYHSRPLRIVLSGRDGTVRETKNFGGWGDRLIRGVPWAEGGNTGAVALRLKGDDRPPSGQWQLWRVDGSGRPVSRALFPRPGGALEELDPDGPALLTPSGKFALGGHPAQISVW